MSKTQNVLKKIKIIIIRYVEDPFPLDLRSRVVCYIGETSPDLSPRVREHLSKEWKLTYLSAFAEILGISGFSQ